MLTEKKTFQSVLTTRLLLERDGKILFLEQTPENGGCFTLPGGKVQQKEFAKKALTRETLEEIGIKVKSKQMQLIHVTHRKAKNVSEIILFFHGIAKVTHEPIVKELDKFQDFLWLPINEFPNAMPDILKRSLKAIKKGEHFSHFPKTKKHKENTCEGRSKKRLVLGMK